MASNAKIGEIVLVIAVSVFLYYFFWVAIWPFMLIDEGKLKSQRLYLLVVLLLLSHLVSFSYHFIKGTWYFKHSLVKSKLWIVCKSATILFTLFTSIPHPR